jgi:HlyD family secretion protein
VDAFPRETFNGVVSQIRMNPTTVQNVVTYDTIIDFDNPDLKLFPGMTAYVTIPVASAHDVEKIPNGALRFTPDLKPEELRATLKENGIEMGSGGRGRSQGDVQGQPSGTQAPSAPQAAQAPADSSAGAGGGGQRGGYRAGQGGETPGGGTRTREGAPTDIGIVWKELPDKTLKPVQVRTGITDHTLTQVVQVLHGELKEGDEVVIGASKSAARSGGAPGMGRPPGR